MDVDQRAVLGEYFPPLSAHEARVEADRCLYCFDAPCTHACPTHIDIPRFIKKIATKNLAGSAQTIFSANLLGATCARVCPVQELCEGSCVLGSEHKPISIGRLQRYVMDYAQQSGNLPRATEPWTGRTVAVIGSGPAGLSCAGELSRLGHSVTIFEKRAHAGGLSTYGIISIREPMKVAIEESLMVEAMGVAIMTGIEVGVDVSFEHLKEGFDCIVLSVGLGRSPSLGVKGEDRIEDGLKFIEASKSFDPMRVGKNVLVIGAGNTAIDCATIARRVGGGHVTVLYRRTSEQMTCYPHEYEFARKEGIEFRFLLQPVEVVEVDGHIHGLRCVQMALGDPDESGRLMAYAIEGSELVLPADQIIKAIGQVRLKLASELGLEAVEGWIIVDSDFETSERNIFAIGDCIRSAGSASTVMAVQDGKLAACAIDKRLQGFAAEKKAS